MGGKGDREREHSAASFEQHMATFRHTLLCSPPPLTPPFLPPCFRPSLPPSSRPPPLSITCVSARTHTYTHRPCAHSNFKVQSAHAAPPPHDRAACV
jgi:hypothetical protein